jgi:hypothetical protein
MTALCTSLYVVPVLCCPVTDVGSVWLLSKCFPVSAGVDRLALTMSQAASSSYVKQCGSTALQPALPDTPASTHATITIATAATAACTACMLHGHTVYSRCRSNILQTLTWTSSQAYAHVHSQLPALHNQPSMRPPAHTHTHSPCIQYCNTAQLHLTKPVCLREAAAGLL